MKIPSLKLSLGKLDNKSLSLFLWLNMNVLTAVVRFILNRVGIGEGTLREALVFLVTCLPLLVLLLGSTRWVAQKEYLLFLGLYGGLALAAGLSLLLNENLKAFYFRESYGIKPVFGLDGAVFAFLFFSLMDSPVKLRKVLMATAYVSFFYLVFVVLYPALRQGYFYDVAPDGSMMKFKYSLSLGYDLLFPLAMFFTSALKSHRPVHYGFALLCAALIVLYGGRGAVVVMAAFFVLLLFLKLEKQEFNLGKLLLLAGLLLLLLSLILFGDALLALFVQVLKRSNISSRSVQTFLDGSFSDSNGRDLIWKAVIEAIGKGGPFGYGLLGDRPFGATVNYVGYSHNLFLELLCNFGVIGALIIVGILVDAYRMLVLCRNDEWKMLYAVLFICSCKLMFSFSLWYTWEFWAAAAVAYRYRTLAKSGSLIALPQYQ